MPVAETTANRLRLARTGWWCARDSSAFPAPRETARVAGADARGGEAGGGAEAPRYTIVEAVTRALTVHASSAPLLGICGDRRGRRALSCLAQVRVELVTREDTPWTLRMRFQEQRPFTWHTPHTKKFTSGTRLFASRSRRARGPSCVATIGFPDQGAERLVNLARGVLAAALKLHKIGR
jgi:hypothetical protein